MRAHTNTPKAKVGARARTKRANVPRGILALSFAVVLLAATASTASAARALYPWHCPPLPAPPTSLEQIPAGCLDPFSTGPRFDFGDRRVGTTSPAQGFALGVYGNDDFNPEISVSGDYAQTNNCPPRLSAGAFPQIQGCLITVTFSPTGTGPKEGILSTGPGGPTATLTGNGVTTRTPPALPPVLEVRSVPMMTLARKIRYITAITNTDSSLVARGSKIRKTTKQLKAMERTRITAALKHLKRIKEKPTRPEIKIKFAATDEFGQTATEEIKIKLCRRLEIPGRPIERSGHTRPICRWHPSRK